MQPSAVEEDSAMTRKCGIVVEDPRIWVAWEEQIFKAEEPQRGARAPVMAGAHGRRLVAPCRGGRLRVLSSSSTSAARGSESFLWAHALDECFRPRVRRRPG